MFSAFSDHEKDLSLHGERFILSSVMNEKRFFPFHYLQLIAVYGLSRNTSLQKSALSIAITEYHLIEFYNTNEKGPRQQSKELKPFLNLN